MDVETLRASMAALVSQLDRERAAARSTASVAAHRISEIEKERDSLRASHERLRQELDLWKRRLFVAKAERADNEKQLALEFAEKMRQLDELAGTLGIGDDKPDTDGKPARDGKPKGNRARGRGTGRRDLRTLPLEEERIELPDPHLEKLVEEGKIVRHGFEESAKLLYKRGGKRRVIIARVRYKAVDPDGNTDVITAAMPPEMIPSAIAAPSLMAHILIENIAKGMPLFRLEESFDRDGIGIDRGTMSRWKKRIGDKLAQTVVLAMHKHALATAFCIATDATGVNVQPIYSQQKGRQPCQKSHFLVMAADRDHLLYEYLEKENGRSIYSRFLGFSGYVQSDAKSVPQDARHGSSAAATTTRAARPRSSRLSHRRACTGSISKSICAASFASCRSGPRTACLSSLRSSGPARALDSTPTSSRLRSDGSRSRLRSTRARRPSNQLRAEPDAITLISMRPATARRYTAPCSGYTPCCCSPILQTNDEPATFGALAGAWLATQRTRTTSLARPPDRQRQMAIGNRRQCHPCQSGRPGSCRSVRLRDLDDAARAVTRAGPAECKSAAAPPASATQSSKSSPRPSVRLFRCIIRSDGWHIANRRASSAALVAPDSPASVQPR
jgi:transposase